MSIVRRNKSILALLLAALGVLCWQTYAGPPANLAPAVQREQRCDLRAPPTAMAPTVAEDISSDRADVGTEIRIISPGLESAVAFASLANGDGTFDTRRTRLLRAQAKIELPGPWFDGAEKVALRVGVAGSGIRKTTIDVEVAKGTRAEVTIMPDRGLELAGRVVDTQGAGIANLPIVVTTHRRAVAIQPGSFATDDALYSGMRFDEARTLTDEDGAFVVGGLPDAPHYIYTSDLSWVIVPDDRDPIPPPRREVEMRAERACNLELTVTNARTGALIPFARARVKAESDGSSADFTCKCSDGRGRVAWAARGPSMRAREGFAAIADISAFGYEPQHIRVPYPAGELSAAVSVALQPLEMGEFVFDVSVEDGGAPPRRMKARISGLMGRHVLTLTRDEHTPTYRCAVPAGQWEVDVYPEGAFGIVPLAWHGTVIVPADGIATGLIRVPSYGSIAVDTGPFESLLLDLRIHGSWITTGIYEGRHLIPGIRSGSWPYRLRGRVDGVLHVVSEGEVCVQSRETCTLTVNR